MSWGDDPSLPTAGLEVLSRTSRSEVVAAASRLSVSDGVWGAESNRYYKDAGERVQSDGEEVSASNYAEFVDYLSASSFAQLSDSWGYFGRSISAVMRGDLGTAVHLGYYAELRATLALLASEGIFIGNRWSGAVTGNGIVEQLTKSGTHNAAWQCLSAWLDLDDSLSRIEDVIRPGGTPLSTWGAAFPSGGAHSALRSLLEAISFDLQAFAGDRRRRNLTSYGVTRLVPGDLQPAELRQLVVGLWNLLEPAGPGSFPLLDGEMARWILTTAFTSVAHAEEYDDGAPAAGSEESAAKAVPSATVAANVNSVDATQSTWQRWADRAIPAEVEGTELYRRILDADPVIDGASPLAPALVLPEGPALTELVVAPMLTRIGVLLRLSTGMLLRFADEAGLSPERYDTWLSSLAVARGLIASEEEFAEVATELFSDVRGAADSLREADVSTMQAFRRQVVLNDHLDAGEAVLISQFAGRGN